MPDAARCSAVVIVHDDRWGPTREYCTLPASHAGDHRTPRTACEPVAYLGWADA